MSDITYVKERPQNATATIKGIVRLAGDLGGTADAPTVVHISPSVTVGLVSGGTGADLSATGPGLLAQASGGANVTLVSTSAGLRGVISDKTGTEALVFATTPTLVTPVLGVATATSINKVAITAPATGSTLTIANGKTLTVNDTMTLAGAYTLTLGGTSTVNGSLVGSMTGGGTVATGGFTLTVGATSSINQNVTTTGSPTFAGLLVSGNDKTIQFTDIGSGVVRDLVLAIGTNSFGTNTPGMEFDTTVASGNAMGYIFNIAGVPKISLDRNGNFGVSTTTQFGSGIGVIGIANATTDPSGAAPTGGGVLFASGGALYWRGTAGVSRLVAAA